VLRFRRLTTLEFACLATGVLACTGGARPTGLAWVDPVLLALAGMSLASAGARAKTLPLYCTAAIAVLLQTHPLPRALALAGLALALARGLRLGGRVLGSWSAGLTYAAAVGTPNQPGAVPLWVPAVGMTWIVLSARRHSSPRYRRRLERAVVVSTLVLTSFTALGAIAAVSARGAVERSADLLHAGLEAARSGHPEEAREKLDAAMRAIRQAEGTLGAIWARPAWLVPGLSQNLRALHDLAGSAANVADRAEAAAALADFEGLVTRSGQIDLDAVAAMEQPLADLHLAVETARADVSQADSHWLLPPVRRGIGLFRGELDEAIPYTRLALEAVRSSPDLLGASEPRTYLVLFTTPVEARATLGFPGNFAEVTFSQGRFEMTRFGRVLDLVRALPDGGGTLTNAEEYMARYGAHRPNWELRNVTMSPDLPTVATVLAQLYPQAGGTAIDGVMIVDPNALGALLDLTGPIHVAGLSEPLTESNAANYLLRDQYLVFDDSPERIDALETIAEATFKRLETIDFPGVARLRETVGPAVEDKHLQVWVFDDKASRLLDRLGLSGRYPTFTGGDFVGVTTTNAAGSKIDLFSRRELDYEVRWDPSSGRLEATVTVRLINDAPSTGLPEYVIGNSHSAEPGQPPLPNGWNHQFVTLYTPWDDEGVMLDGEPIGVIAQPELGRRALSTYVSVPPGGSRTLTFHLRGDLDTHDYRLVMAAQPMVEPEDVTVRIRVAGGRQLEILGPAALSGGVVEGHFQLAHDEEIVIRR